MNLERNAITSIFLRQLEYYQGILLLTTNRLESLDPAFESRIHFCFEYDDLDTHAIRQIWEGFLSRSASQGLPIELSLQEREEIAGILL
ncbi:hypothetical protein BJY01DRAFT_213107 [Aspergillus pseudoustus]|uniref:ATPase AAA-type core domain-containing protein n=1 Tax=Aspergillus pseudoustus TaxID=1810923 RepID=A0ABR4K3F6_9EURO